MLLFKPAPIYILDEVDAALDLSHTQNIGQMLRTHFRHSQVRLKHGHRIVDEEPRVTAFNVSSLQFVVVSLKDGMFTNANVLFKTKFVDGMSTVTRTALSQSDANVPQKAREKACQKDKRSKQLINWWPALQNTQLCLILEMLRYFCFDMTPYCNKKKKMCGVILPGFQSYFLLTVVLGGTFSFVFIQLSFIVLFSPAHLLLTTTFRSSCVHICTK